MPSVDKAKSSAKPAPTGICRRPHRRQVLALTTPVAEPRLSRYAPKYHFYSPVHPHCMAFDPNGCLYWNGRHHLFYIFQDPGRSRGSNGWGHASSPDLLTWTIHPPAMVAGSDDPETDMYSGCAMINRDGIPVLVYHGLGAGCCIATPLDNDLIRWQKSPHNPVIPLTDNTLMDDVYHVFDPYAWVEGDHYLAILGSRLKPYNQRDTAYLFRSTDMIQWEYLRPFFVPNSHWTEECEDMACPDFFRLGDRYILLGISHPFGARYYVGDYLNETFIPRAHHRLNHPGGSLFAPESYLDGENRRLVWFWAHDQQRDPIPECGNNVMALLRVATLAPGADQINWTIPAEYARLRGKARRCAVINLQPKTNTRVNDINGDALELELILPEVASRLEIRVLESPDGREYASVVITPERQVWSIDAGHIGNRAEVWNRVPIYPHEQPAAYTEVTEQVAPFPLQPGEKLHLRIFIDRSIIEVFAKGQSLMQRVYPVGADNRFLTLRSNSAVTIDHLIAWEMGALEYRLDNADCTALG